MLKFNKTGQIALEYTIILIIVLGALLGAQNYVSRGMQGRWKSAVDDLGDQYDPRMANTSIRHVLASNTVTVLDIVTVPGGEHTSRIDSTNSLERKTGYMGLGPY